MVQVLTKFSENRSCASKFEIGGTRTAVMSNTCFWSFSIKMYVAHWGRTNATELHIPFTEYSRFDLTTNVYLQVFWDVTPYCLVDSYRHVDGYYCVHLQG